MKIERTKSAARGIVFGIMAKMYQLAVPFLMRTAMIYFMGVEYLGLNSLFSSVLQVLNLAELGVGVAMVFSMYKPIAEDNLTTICALMRLYKIYYRVIGLVIAVIGCALTPFVPYLIRGDVPNEVNIYILYLLNLGATVLSYWLFAYKGSILRAHQRNDVISKVTLATCSIQYLLQLLALCILRNYYIYIILSLATQALTNILTAFYAERLYPQYQAHGKLSKDEVKELNRKIADLFTAQLGVVVNNSVDAIVISAFLGLVPLATYNNYYYIITAVIGLSSVVFDSVTAGIGNSLVTESNEKNYGDLRKFTFIVFWMTNFCCCCLLCLCQPFMYLWVGEELMLSYGHVVVLVVFFIVQTVRKIWVVYKDAAGAWHQDRFRPLVTALCNLVLNLMLVQHIGLYGVMLSTILAEGLISIPWLLRNVFTYVIYAEHREYLRDLAGYLLVLVLSCGVCVLTCSVVSLSPVLTLLVNLLVCIFVSNVIQTAIYQRKAEFSYARSMLRGMLAEGISR